MNIFPVPSKEGSSYASSPVYTTIKGVRVLVCEGYLAKSRAEICAQAYLNAKVRHMVAAVGDKLRVGSV